MKALIAGEESQRITIELRKLGWEAYSCDFKECSGGHPEWHFKDDLRNYLDEYFDLVIFHPVCKYAANSGSKHLYTEYGRWEKLQAACDFFNLRHMFNSPHVATEWPIIHKHAKKLVGNYDQLFQPWHFGHKEMKGTCLWLKGLPKLIPTNIVGPPPKDPKERKKWAVVHRMPPGPNREMLRSRTYKGVAKAMATQWSEYILSV